jgi:hypothetical protein
MVLLLQLQQLIIWMALILKTFFDLSLCKWLYTSLFISLHFFLSKKPTFTICATAVSTMSTHISSSFLTKQKSDLLRFVSIQGICTTDPRRTLYSFDCLLKNRQINFVQYLHIFKQSFFTFLNLLFFLSTLNYRE